MSSIIKIDKNKLKLLLENKKDIIEIKKGDGIGEIISGVSLVITLCLANFNQIEFIKPFYFKLFAWGVTFIILALGIRKAIKSAKNPYSVDDLCYEIIDLDPDIDHPFNIILIKNNMKSGKYLLFYSTRWKCWLFPNYKSKNHHNEKAERSYIKDCIYRDLNVVINEENINYLGDKLSTKPSVPHNYNKKYHFHFYTISDNFSLVNKKRVFRSNGQIYTWKTLNTMYKNRNILKKNKDVLDFIRKKDGQC